MGRDKALLPWRGTTLSITRSRLQAVTDDVRILCGPEPRYLERSCRRRRRSRQRSRGIALGSRRRAGQPACCWRSTFQRHARFVARARRQRGDGDAVVPVGARGPLCAAYRGGCAEPIAPPRRRDLKMTSFWPTCACARSKARALARLGTRWSCSSTWRPDGTSARSGRLRCDVGPSHPRAPALACLTISRRSIWQRNRPWPGGGSRIEQRRDLQVRRPNPGREPGRRTPVSRQDADPAPPR